MTKTFSNGHIVCKRTTNRTRAARFATSQRRARRPLIIALLMGALALTSVPAALAATQGPGGAARPRQTRTS